MDTMEIREAIDEAIASGNPDGLSRIATRVLALRDEALSELRNGLDAALAALDAGGADVAAAAVAAAALVRLRYVDRMVDRIEGSEE
jgi:ethanolamine utilization microcompartment shell protein EutL